MELWSDHGNKKNKKGMHGIRSVIVATRRAVRTLHDGHLNIVIVTLTLGADLNIVCRSVTQNDCTVEDVSSQTMSEDVSCRK